MQYETFLFTRNQRQDFTAFIRPTLMTNKDVSAVGAIFNYISDISRLTAEFPSLYCFPLGEYLLLLRHYKCGRTHAGRAIGVIEGIAVKRGDEREFTQALASIVDQQSELLNVTGSVIDIEALEAEVSPENTWDGQRLSKPSEPFVSDFLERRERERLFVPFNPEGREMLVTTLADQRFSSPTYFAFGTNSDVLAQLDRGAPVDIVSFFKTERPSFRSRTTNHVTQNIGEEQEELASSSSMSLRTASSSASSLRQPLADDQVDEDTLVGKDAVSIRSFQSSNPKNTSTPVLDDEDDPPTALTMRQMRDKIRAEEAATQPEAQTEPSGFHPLDWLRRLFASLVSPPK